MSKSQFLVKEELSQLPYTQLYLLDLINDGQIATYLNQNGFSHKTVCPECRIDDFTHVQGCSHDKWIFPYEETDE